jgi:hypothetical protein
LHVNGGTLQMQIAVSRERIAQRARGLLPPARVAFWSSRIDFIGSQFKKNPPLENAVKIVKWSGTFMAKLKLP